MSNYLLLQDHPTMTLVRTGFVSLPKQLLHAEVRLRTGAAAPWSSSAHRVIELAHFLNGGYRCRGSDLTYSMIYLLEGVSWEPTELWERALRDLICVTSHFCLLCWIKSLPCTQPGCVLAAHPPPCCEGTLAALASVSGGRSICQGILIEMELFGFFRPQGSAGNPSSLLLWGKFWAPLWHLKHKNTLPAGKLLGWHDRS